MGETLREITSNLQKAVPAFLLALFLSTPPHAERGVQKSLSGEEGEKTPFAIMEMRSGNCITKAKGGGPVKIYAQNCLQAPAE